MSDNLGSLVWYTIRDQEIARQDIKNKLIAAGLDEAFTPKKTAPSDAFRRAVRDSEQKKIPRFDGTFVNFLLRYVSHTKDELACHVVREIVDAASRRLDYQQVAEVGLDRANNIVYRNDFLARRDDEPDVPTEVARRYERCLDHYNGSHLRIIVHDVLRTLNPIAVRPSGGVYFIPAEGGKTLHNLQKFVQSLGGESDLWLMPVLDNEDARMVIRSTLDNEVESVSGQVINDLYKLLQRKGEVSEADQRRALHELHRLQNLTAQYEEILEDKMLSAQTRLDVALRQVKNLLAA